MLNAKAQFRLELLTFHGLCSKPMENCGFQIRVTYPLSSSLRLPCTLFEYTLTSNLFETCLGRGRLKEVREESDMSFSEELSDENGSASDERPPSPRGAPVGKDNEMCRVGSVSYIKLCILSRVLFVVFVTSLLSVNSL